MPILRIEQNVLKREDVDDFKWNEWRAVRIWRESRTDGDYLFAFALRNYGVIEETHALDLGNKKEDEITIGRSPKIVGERGWEQDPKKKGFGSRVYKEPETEVEEVFNEDTGKWEQQSYQHGKTIWEYYCKATPKMIANFEKMVGPLESGRTTQFIFSFGSRFEDIPDAKEFFAHGDVVAKWEERANRIEQEKLKKLPLEE